MFKKILIILIAIPMLMELFIDDIPSYIEKSKQEPLPTQLILENEIIDVIIADREDTPEIHEQAHVLTDINGNQYRSLYYVKGSGVTICPGSNCGCRGYDSGHYVYERIN